MHRGLIIHIEVQSDYEKEFSKRMFKYFYRIYDKFGENVESIAILTDTNKNFRPGDYTYKKFQTGLHFYYGIYKIENYKEEDLRKIQNPFALAVLATKYLNKKKTKKEYNKRLDFKRKLARLMFERDYPLRKLYAKHEEVLVKLIK